MFQPGGPQVYAKLEFLNPGGSVKDRAAKYIVERWVQDGLIRPGSHVVESTSGNFGVALAMMACIYDFRLTLVVDPNITPSNLAILFNYGATLDMVRLPDPHGGFLHARLERVKEILAEDPSAVWINQYANQAIPEAHYRNTAEEILVDFSFPIDYLVVAVSTTGTLNGVARRLKEAYPRISVVAVDAVGSVLFGGPPGPRRLPGIGAGRVPELMDENLVDKVIRVTDDESIRGSRELLSREAIFAGGSSGSIVAAIQKLVTDIQTSATVVTLLPDRGDRYLDMIYSVNSENVPATPTQLKDLIPTGTPS